MGTKIAIVGRPNVGKSTLFNRLIGKRLALVNDSPGVTRDYRVGDLALGNHRVSVLDTAGMEVAQTGELEADIRRATEHAVAMSEACIFLFNARDGVLPGDREIAEILRKTSKPIILAGNKCEGSAGLEGCLEAYEFGFGSPVGISAEHGDGIGELLAVIRELQVELEGRADLAPGTAGPVESNTDRPLKIAVVGRPNAGKSSLINRIVGEDRLVTGTEPGTTRDSIGLDVNWFGSRMLIHDTAGMRKRSRIVDTVEKISVADSLAAIRFAETVVLLLDVAIPLEVQDLRIADLAEREGRPVVIAVNKWDTVRNRQQCLAKIAERVEDRLPEIRGTPVVTVSALTGEGMEELQAAILSVWSIWNRRVSTGLLNRWLEDMTRNHPPPAVRGRPIRFRYMTQAKSRPPSFVAMCSHPRHVPTGYRRYLKNGLRHTFGFDGTPIRIYLRSRSERNPFAPEPR